MCWSITLIPLPHHFVLQEAVYQTRNTNLETLDMELQGMLCFLYIYRQYVCVYIYIYTHLYVYIYILLLRYIYIYTCVCIVYILRIYRVCRYTHYIHALYILMHNCWYSSYRFPNLIFPPVQITIYLPRCLLHLLDSSRPAIQHIEDCLRSQYTAYTLTIHARPGVTKRWCPCWKAKLLSKGLGLGLAVHLGTSQNSCPSK